MGRPQMSRTAELYACLYAKEFPAQALLRLRPELHGRSCVVMEGEPSFQQVCSLNIAARLLGMKHGMTRVEIDAFQDPLVLLRSLPSEAATKAILFECAAAFSPRIEDCSEDTALLCSIDIGGTQSLFGPPAMLAKSLLQRVRALGISAQIVVSCNFHAAVCLAKAPSQCTSIQVIPSGEEAAALASLPLNVLELTEQQAETFALWGIHRRWRSCCSARKRVDCPYGPVWQTSSSTRAGGAGASVPTSRAGLRS